MQRIMITIPEELLMHTDRAVKRSNQNRSEFIRKALSRHLAYLEAKEFEALLAEGYQSTMQSSAEFSQADLVSQTIGAEDLWEWDE